MRRPYVEWYMAREWGVHKSWDRDNEVVQVDIGRLGVTIPYRRRRKREA